MHFGSYALERSEAPPRDRLLHSLVVYERRSLIGTRQMDGGTLVELRIEEQVCPHCAGDGGDDGGDGRGGVGARGDEEMKRIW